MFAIRYNYHDGNLFTREQAFRYLGILLILWIRGKNVPETTQMLGFPFRKCKLFKNVDTLKAL